MAKNIILDKIIGKFLPNTGTTLISYVVAAVLGIASSGPIDNIASIPSIFENLSLTL